MKYKNLCSQVLLRSMELTEIATIVESTPPESRTKMLQDTHDWIMQSAPPGEELPKSSALVSLIATYVKSTGIIDDIPSLQNQEHYIANVFLILLFLASTAATPTTVKLEEEEKKDDTDSIDDDRQVKHLFEHLLFSKNTRPSKRYEYEYKIDQSNFEVNRLISEFWKWEVCFHLKTYPYNSTTQF